MERLDRLGQGIGQRFVNHGVDPDPFVILAQQPVAVGADPQDVLIPVFQQREDAAIHGNPVRFIPPPSGRAAGIQPPESVVAEREQPVVPVAFDGRQSVVVETFEAFQVEDPGRSFGLGIEAVQDEIPAEETDGFVEPA